MFDKKENETLCQEKSALGKILIRVALEFVMEHQFAAFKLQKQAFYEKRRYFLQHDGLLWHLPSNLIGVVRDEDRCLALNYEFIFLVMAEGFEPDTPFLFDFFHDFYSGRYGIVKSDRGFELQGLRKINSARTREDRAEYR